MLVAGLCLVVITIIIPWGVFTRYVLNYGSAWPEPLAVLLMIWFSFTAAALCYRERLHISVQILPMVLQGTPRLLIGWAIECAMAGMNLFMLVWGVRLVHTTWFQAISDFPADLGRYLLSAGADRRRDHAGVRGRAVVDGPSCSRSRPTATWRR